MIEKLKHILKKIEFNKRKPLKDDNHLHLSEDQIQIIAEYAIAKLRSKSEKNNQLKYSLESNLSELNPNLLNSKQKVIEQCEFSVAVQIGGLIILVFCAWYWIWFFFILQEIEPLTYSAYITLILLSLTMINKFESVFLNSITGITVYGFVFLTIGSLFVSHSGLISILIGPFLYGLIAIFQLLLVFHPKIPVSKRYMIWGFLFYLLFLSSFETFTHVNVVIGASQRGLSELAIAVLMFYILTLSYVFIYFYKKKFGVLLP